jgi:hypothetical protein
MAVDSRSHFDFDDIAEFAALICRAPLAVILKRDPVTDAITTIARYGFTNDFTNAPPPPRLILPGETFVIYKDVQNDPKLKGHQVQSIIPRIKTLIGVRLTSTDQKGETVMGVFNAPLEFFDNDAEFSRYVKYAMMLQGLFEDVKERPLIDDYYSSPQRLHVAEHPSPQLSVTPSSIPTDPAAQFLFDTLAHKQSLHVRNGASYVSLRSWRKPIKDYQISALAAAKLFPPENFIDQVAVEMVACARQLYGTQTLASVVPVPGGSSATTNSFSERLAARVASKLALPVKYALSPQNVSKGKSHPSKSAKLQPYTLQESLTGTVLLIDDVATSGRHIELAQKAIRASGNDCFALSWIGP